MVEMLTSISLFVLIWISLMGSVLVGKAIAVRAKHRMQATYAAQRQIESLRKQVFGAIANSTSAVTIDTRGTESTADDLMGIQTTTVTSPEAAIKKIIVEITWRERRLVVGSLMTTETIGTCIANDPQVN